MCKKSKKPTKTIYDWPVASIPAPDLTAIADGEPVSTVEDMSGNRALLHNRVQKLRRVCGVSEFAEDVNTPAGVDSEFRFSKANSLTSLKRAIEAVFCSDQDSSLVGTTHKTRGLGSWISNSAQADNPVPAAYRTPAASIRTVATASLTELMVRQLMQSVYEQTGTMGDFDLICGTNLRSAISLMTIYEPSIGSFSNVRTFFAKLEKNTLDYSIDVIKGDFGLARVHPSLWLNYTTSADTHRGYLLEMDDISMCANKLPGFTPLPFDDSGPRGVVSAIVGNKMGSPLRHGKIIGS